MGLPEIISGRVWKLGDHVNTDVLHPSSYFSLNEARVKEGLMEGMEILGADLNRNSAEDGLVIVAGKNFGCGSSRETSARSLRTFGVRGVVAFSFARIFMRSLVNLSIPTLECSEIQDLVKNGDLIHIHFNDGRIELPDGRHISFSAMDLHIKRILEAGGLIPYLLREMNGIRP